VSQSNKPIFHRQIDTNINISVFPEGCSEMDEFHNASPKYNTSYALFIQSTGFFLNYLFSCHYSDVSPYLPPCGFSHSLHNAQQALQVCLSRHSAHFCNNVNRLHCWITAATMASNRIIETISLDINCCL